MILTKEEYPNPPLGWYLDQEDKCLMENTNNGVLFYPLNPFYRVRKGAFSFWANPKIKIGSERMEGRQDPLRLIKKTDLLYGSYYLGDNKDFYILLADKGEWLPRHSKKGELITDDHGNHYIVSKTYTFDDIKYPPSNHSCWSYGGHYDNEGNPTERWNSKFVEKIFDALEKAGKGLPDGVIAYETYCVNTAYRRTIENVFFIDYQVLYDYAKKKEKEAKKQLALAS